MKKSILIAASVAFLLGISAVALSAQSLLDNEFYNQAKDELAKGDQAMQAGDYDLAASLAAQAQENLAKSDEYVATSLMFYRANGWLSQANDRIAYAKSIEADTNYKDAYDTAVTDAGGAKDALDAKDYDKSIGLSKDALAALADIAPVVAKAPPPPPPPPPAAEPTPLPQYYTVQLVISKRDCFWRIAGFPFVYNDPWKWRLLYDANKSLLGKPDNPNLIEPGQRFVIPSASGEKREGDYDPAVTYPTYSPEQ
jgi:nucleoid-associated protein YgaU